MSFALEWNQLGIRDDECDEFICLLISLYRGLKFSVDGLAIEEDMRDLFDINGEYITLQIQL